MQTKHQADVQKKAKRLLKIGDLCEKTKFSKSFIYAEIDKKRFPKPVKVGRSSFWLESEIDAFIDDLIARRDPA